MSDESEAAERQEWEEERALIERHSKMLAEGTVGGPRTITRLVELTGLKRWKITLRHVDLKNAFQESIGKTSHNHFEMESMQRKLVCRRP
ncbi:hypothetical protein [Cryobacterium sp. MDB2-10]|uniref:hypothetical protein n=1 Tax=Cryobacterium sp. MDB2-10 TaxID=1259177 RepID=UPI00107469AC|nr:hypothetical protein [Cryobacterium sp. MDB2-10]TFC17151.1 hypothetical protein E3O51_11555 [Cryobacterium sp. MDB2-10]